jgi:LmbE family N-acetylglucosaminyl deacetylase
VDLIETLTQKPVAIVAAHPDDETAGAGGLLPRMSNPLIVTITNGGPRNSEYALAAGYQWNDDYVKARRQELLNALEVAGVRETQSRMLGVYDQEASLHMVDIARRVVEMLSEAGVGAVLTHPYEGGHPDHDAAAFAVHAACALLTAPPRIYEFTSYHAASASGGMEVGHFLPGEEHGQTITLTEKERERKSRMIECFATQAQMLSRFPIDMERFRGAPVYDFTQPPHTGKLFYENFEWGMEGDRWRALAEDAMESLGLSGVL